MVATGIVIGGTAYLTLDEKYEFGRRMGRLDGLDEAITALIDEFDTADNGDRGEGKRLFGLKATDVIAVTIDGVRTVRVVP